MSDVIARMRLESQDFDNKLKSATANLQHMEREVRRTGATFEYADKEEIAFLESLGTMQTKAMDAKGRIKELSNSYKELAMMYERMTDAEKQSQPGKTLAKSLQQIKTELETTKQSFANVSKQIGEGGGGLGGALDQLAGKFGMNITKLAGWGAAIGAAKAALDVMKDAFFANEGNLDEWGRTVESTKSLYQGFLNALNNGDISGFLSRMDEIVSGARKAYDAMDELGTFTAFNQRNVAKSRADYAKALDEYRLNPSAQNKQTLSDANDRVMNDLRESHQKTEDAYQAALRELAQQRLSSKELQDAFVKAFSEGNYGELKTLKSSYSTGTGLAAGQQYFNGMRTYGGRVDETGSGQWRDMTDAEKQQFEFARALSQVNDSQIKEVQALGAQSVQITEQIYQQDRAYNRLAGNNAPLQTRGGNKPVQVPVEPVLPEGSIAKLQDELKKANEKFNLAGTDEERAAAKKSIDEITASIEKLQGKTKETAQEGSIAYMRQQLQDLQKQWELAANPATREELKKQIGEVATALGEMEGKNKTATSALSMWGDHQAKIDETMNLLRQFYTMMDDPNIGEGQRKWAEDMAKSYEEQLKKMMGDTDTAVATMQDLLNNLSSGVGAISTIGNAFNDLKGIGEDLTAAFSGEMDAWDSLMAVFNSGISIMETVIGVMEAINTLTNLSTILTGANTAAKEAEATATVTGATEEVAAEGEKATASGIAAGASAAESAASAGKSVAGIPVIGPILAVAAIGAVLAAVLAAMSKSKSAGKFAQGGVVGGNSYSGDRLMAYVNSGETILTPQQADRAVAGIQGNPMSNLRLSTEISGQNLRVVLNNDNRARGGGRTFYSEIHK